MAAQWNSDRLLTAELLKQLQQRVQEGPCFSFSVTYQNHGPYSTEPTTGTAYLTPEHSGMSAEACNIFNNYLKGVSDTIGAMTGLAAGLEAMEEPVVLVLFGDHKPWAGNGNSAYTAAGANFDIATPDGLYDYYSAPYLIWANSAAKAALGREFVGEGGDFSPCFLMPELFDRCGWEGPGFMQLAREMREITPLLHERDLYLREGALTDTLGEAEQAFLTDYINAQYYRETGIDPQ